MKAIALNGSPHKGGNTNTLLTKVLEPIAEAGIETELIHIGCQALRGCIGCFRCKNTTPPQCVIDNDKMNEYIEKMFDADAIIIGSPTYFASVTAETKALLDRVGFVARMNGNPLKRKIGAAVSAVRRGGAVPTVDTINHMFQIQQMILPGSTYWNFGLGLMPGDVEGDDEGIANMQDLGETIAWLLQKLR